MCVVEGSWWLSGKQIDYNEGEQGLIPGSGRSPGEGNGYPLQNFFFFFAVEFLFLTTPSTTLTPVFLPGESHGQRGLAASISWRSMGLKSFRLDFE